MSWVKTQFQVEPYLQSGFFNGTDLAYQKHFQNFPFKELEHDYFFSWLGNINEMIETFQTQNAWIAHFTLILTTFHI